MQPAKFVLVFPDGTRMPLLDALKRYTVAQLVTMAANPAKAMEALLRARERPVDSREEPAAPADSSQAPAPPAPQPSPPDARYLLPTEARRQERHHMLLGRMATDASRWWARRDLVSATTSEPVFGRDMRDLTAVGDVERRGNKAGTRYRITEQGLQRSGHTVPAGSVSPRVRKELEREDTEREERRRRIATGEVEPHDGQPTLEGRIMNTLSVQAMSIPRLAARLGEPPAAVAAAIGKLRAEGNASKLDDGTFMAIL